MAQGQERVGAGRPKQKEAHRLFWAALAAPGIIWLALLFVVPFYAILAIAGGQQIRIQPRGHRREQPDDEER